MGKDCRNILVDVNNLAITLHSADPKLKVSSLPLDTQVNIIDGDIDNIYSKGKSPIEVIYELPNELSQDDTPEGVGTVRISSKSRRKLINEAMNANNPMQYAYIRALPYIIPIIKNSILLEEHRDRVKNANGKRFPDNESDINIDKIQRLYGAVKINGEMYRTKTTIQCYAKENQGNRYHGYDITKIELLGPKSPSLDISPLGVVTLPNNSSISIAKLIENVELSYESGVKLSEAMTKAHKLKHSINQKKKKSKGFKL